MVFLAVNIGLSLPSKAAHQLPWLPSVCVRVKERERGEKKEEHHVSKIKARFHACFWPSWVFAFPSSFHPFSPLPVLGLRMLSEPLNNFPRPSVVQIPHSLKSDAFVGKWKQRHFFGVSLKIFCSLQATGPELSPNDDNTWNNIWISSRRAAS